MQLRPNGNHAGFSESGIPKNSSLIKNASRVSFLTRSLSFFINVQGDGATKPYSFELLALFISILKSCRKFGFAFNWQNFCGIEGIQKVYLGNSCESLISKWSRMSATFLFLLSCQKVRCCLKARLLAIRVAEICLCYNLQEIEFFLNVLGRLVEIIFLQT